jgi:diacylglycerol kinase family enzyme
MSPSPPSPDRRAPSNDTPAPPSPERRIAVVVNGNAKNVTEDIIATIDEILDQGDLFVSRRIEQGVEIARTIIDRGYETVLTGGGDGTFTVLVTAVCKEADRRGLPRPRFGLLRLGTGNSLAWVVGASRAKKGRGLAADLARLQTDAGSRPMRLIEAEGVLTPFCGMGVDAVVLRDYLRTKSFLAKSPLKPFSSGGLAYFLAATTQSIPGYLVRPMPHCRVINLGEDAFRIGPRGQVVGAPIRKGEVIYEGRMRMAACSTIPYYGFGLRVFPFALDREDRMNLRIATVGSIEFVSNFPSIWTGKYENLESIFDYFVDHVRIEVDPNTPFQIGGDPQGDRSEVVVRLNPEPIQLVDFYAPPRS